MIKGWITKNLRRAVDISARPLLFESAEETQRELLAAQYLAPLMHSYIPWSRAALAPSAVATILNDIIMNQRKTIVELGGGISTIYIARLLAERNEGMLYTIEHDANWLKTLSAMLDKEKIGQRVSLIHAPLRTLKRLNNDRLKILEWYDEGEVDRQTKNLQIDQLIVDGPNPTPEDLYNRFPAVPILLDKLSDSNMVLLDDAGRKGEREILKIWETLLGTTLQRIGKYAIGFQKTLYKPFV